MNFESRLLRHPGRPDPVRIESIEGAARTLAFDVPPA